MSVIYFTGSFRPHIEKRRENLSSTIKYLRVKRINPENPVTMIELKALFTCVRCNLHNKYQPIDIFPEIKSNKWTLNLRKIEFDYFFF